MRARVIGLGQAAAGDDGVGLAVVEQLAQRGVSADIDLVRAAEEVALVSLLETAAPVVLVDAVLGEPPGEVLELSAPQLAERRGRVSTHGFGICAAIDLARALAPDQHPASIQIVAVTIARPRRHEQRLSPAVAAAVPVAADRVLALLGR